MTWKTVKLADAAIRIGGGTPSRNVSEYWGGDIPWFTVADLKDIADIQKLSYSREAITREGLEKSAAKLVPGGAVVFSSRVVVGKVGISQNELVTNQDFSSFIPSSEFDTEFLAYFLIKSKLDLRDHQRGATIKGVTTKTLENLDVPKPSITEQRRIVTRIKECMERVEEIEECNSEISLEMVAFYPSILNELFGDLAVKCGVRRLDEVANVKGGGSLPKGQSTDPGRRDGVLLIKVGDMNEKGNERIVATSRAYLDRKSAGKKVIPAGAVLFPKRGGAIATNKKRMLGRPALVDPNMMAVIANPEHLLPAYLYYWTQTFKLESISNGGVIPQLNRKDLAPLEIPVPSLEEQKLFIFKMEQAEASWFEMVQTHTQAVAERTALREAILRKAFAGGL